jgi:DNA-binding NtrC family response regulator
MQINSSRPFTVLLVDDDTDWLQLLKLNLEHEGFYVEFASNHTEAIRVYESSHIDIAVLDVSMPGRHGLSLLQHLRHRSADLPLIVATALEDEYVSHTAYQFGALAFVQKPCLPSTITDTVRRTLERQGDKSGYFSADQVSLN